MKIVPTNYQKGSCPPSYEWADRVDNCVPEAWRNLTVLNMLAYDCLKCEGRTLRNIHDIMELRLCEQVTGDLIIEGPNITENISNFVENIKKRFNIVY